DLVSLSISLIAAFIPLLFMGGIVGRLFREFSLTLVFAIAVSTIISVTVTPMICAHFVRAPPSPNATRLDRMVEAVLTRMIAFYGHTLRLVIDYKLATFIVFVATIALTVNLYYRVPKSDFPQDDTGLIVFMVPTRDVRVGGRQSRSQYQFTLWSPDLDELTHWVPIALETIRALPGLTDVSTDREQGGLQANVNIDRIAASRLGVKIQDIDN